jgi:tetratricopeptide (TPR) repeat protein
LDADVRRLIDQGTGGAEIPQRLLKDILKSCRGIPLMVEQALATIAEKDIEVMPDVRWVLPPELLDFSMPEASVAETFVNRIAGISGNHLKILQGLALMNQPAGVSLLAKVSEVAPKEVLGTISEFQRTGLVAAERSNDVEAYFLAHGNLRPAILQTLTEEQTNTMHGRIGMVLEEMHRGGTVVSQQQLAFHFLHSADTERAMDHGLKAADEAVAQFSHRVAVDILDKCIPIARTAASVAEPPKSSLERLARMHLARGRAISNLGTLDKGVEEIEAARAIFQSLDDVKGQAFCLVFLAELHNNLNHRADARSCALEALKLATKADDRMSMAAALTLDGQFTSMMPDSVNQAEEKYLRAIKLQKDNGLSSNLPITLIALGHFYADASRFDDATRVMIQAFRLSKRLNLTSRIIEASTNLGSLFLNMGDYAKSIRFLKYGARIATENGAMRHSISTRLHLAISLVNAGELKQAIAQAKQGLRLSRMLGAHRHEGQILRVLAHSYGNVCMYRESLEAAQAALRLEMTDDDRISARSSLGKALLNLGAFSQAIAVLGEPTHAGADRISMGFLAESLIIRANCHLELAEYDKAIASGNRALEIVRKIGPRQYEISILTSIIPIHIQRNDLDAAECDLKVAVELAAKENMESQIAMVKAEFALAKGNVSGEIFSPIPGMIRALDDSEQLSPLFSAACVAARLCAALGDTPTAVKYCRKATDTLKQICTQVPPEHLEGFLNVKSRKRAMEEMKAIMRKAAGENTVS